MWTVVNPFAWPREPEMYIFPLYTPPSLQITFFLSFYHSGDTGVSIWTRNPAIMPTCKLQSKIIPTGQKWLSLSIIMKLLFKGLKQKLAICVLGFCIYSFVEKNIYFHLSQNDSYNNSYQKMALVTLLITPSVIAQPSLNYL